MKYRDYLNLFLSFGESGSGGGSGGGSSEPMRDVNFIDYDGTVVNSYSKEDFLAMTAMPENPSHDGLVAQGWNWSFTDAQNYVQEYGELNVGQMYTTDTGETKIYITIDSNAPSNRKNMAVRFQSSEANNVTLDWGDGTAPVTAGATTATEYQHTYVNTGNYIIKLKVNSGTIFFNTIVYATLPYAASNIRKVEIGDNVTSISTSSFNGCYALSSISISNSVIEIGAYAFQSCFCLKSIVIPISANFMGNGQFTYCHSLESISLSKGVTSLGLNFTKECESLVSISIPDSVIMLAGYVFQKCYSLKSLTIPKSIQSIGTRAFADCPNMGEYHIKPLSVPSLANNGFTNIFSDCKIYVPSESVDAYKTATNWSTYASYIYGE